jgi:hypothetical protein
MITLLDYWSHKKIAEFSTEAGANYWIQRYDMQVVARFPRGYLVVRDKEAVH